MPKQPVRLAILATLFLVLLVPSTAAASTPPSARAAAGCAGQHLMPSPSTVAKVRRATLCLINAERRSRGLATLRYNGRLRAAATRHSRDMARRNYFAHVSLSGASMTDRIRRTGYTRGGGWTIGENLAWGTGDRATARNIMRAWMASPGHRANILAARYREVGIGIALDAPIRGGGQGATYTTNFGRRS